MGPYCSNNEFDIRVHLVMPDNNFFGGDSYILKLAFDKVSGCKSYPSVQAHELNTPI